MEQEYIIYLQEASFDGHISWRGALQGLASVFDQVATDFKRDETVFADNKLGLYNHLLAKYNLAAVEPDTFGDSPYIEPREFNQNEERLIDMLGRHKVGRRSLGNVLLYKPQV